MTHWEEEKTVVMAESRGSALSWMVPCSSRANTVCL